VYYTVYSCKIKNKRAKIAHFVSICLSFAAKRRKKAKIAKKVKKREKITFFT
jgi:tartrate dehydratase alpha subunit/fumarate hydratase class I-like protein